MIYKKPVCHHTLLSVIDIYINMQRPTTPIDKYIKPQRKKMKKVIDP